MAEQFFRSHLVLRHRPDGSTGVLNVIEEPTQAAQKAAAEKAAHGWQGQFPGDRIEVRGSMHAHKCREVNNHPNELAN